MDIVQNESGSTYMRDKFHHEIYQSTDTIDLYVTRILAYIKGDLRAHSKG